MVASGHVVQALVDRAVASAAATSVGLFGAASIAMAGLSWTRSTLTTKLSWRYVEWVETSLAAAALGPVTIAHLEDEQIRSQLGLASEALREGVHQRAVSALVDTWAARLGGVSSAVLLLGFHWWAPLVLLAGYLLLIQGYRIWLRTVFNDFSELTGEARQHAEYYRSLLGDPAAAKEVRLFGLAPWLDDRFTRTWASAMKIIWAQRAKTLKPVVIGAVSMLVALCVVLGGLGFEAGAGLVPVGLILVYVQAVAGMDSLSYQGEAVWHLSRTRQELSTLNWVVDRLATVDTVANTHRPKEVRHGDVDGSSRTAGRSRVGSAVSVQDLGFRYPGNDDAVLRGLSLDIPAGQSVAIVGVNGAGKSTLTKLLCGLYRPTTGRVLIDGESPSMTRRQVAAIFQTFGRYEVSLADNVAFGDIDHRRDGAAIRRRLIEAGASDLLDRVGLDTVLSPSYVGGTDLSGGQWQRVALARALMAASAGVGLLILDEPTAALDIRAEVDLFNRFLDLTRGLTTVLVSHRLSSVRHVDRIVVLSDGVIIEDGPHHELVTAGGRYATMFALQAERFVSTKAGDSETTDAPKTAEQPTGADADTGDGERR